MATLNADVTHAAAEIVGRRCRLTSVEAMAVLRDMAAETGVETEDLAELIVRAADLP